MDKQTPLPHPPDEAIVIKGARSHNLKNLNITIPRDKLVVITGPSGSGKSSLAFDTIYAEGQRRYVESLSVYARQFLDQMSKPELDFISGLSPTISIEQRTTSYNPRSTVGTVTEIHDYLRLLFARLSTPYCYECGNEIKSQSQQQIIDLILASADDAKVAILAPIARERKGEYQKELIQLRQRGFVRVKIDGEIFDLSDDIKLEKNKKHTIEVYVDRLIVKGDRTVLATRVSDAVELALKLGDGLLVFETDNTSQLLSEKFACQTCGINYAAPEPRTFSFNSPMGACETCEGIGIDPKKQEEQEQESSSLEPQGISVLAPEISTETAPCPDCNGARLKKESLHFKFRSKNIFNLSSLPISELKDFFVELKLNRTETLIASRIVKEINDRLGFLTSVGVGYLSLSRSAQSLSGGEAQRIRLATQIGSSLVGVIYVLDEPSIGLHQRDNDKLLDTLMTLRDAGNTVLVVEHDKDTMEKADFIADLGPGAGTEGGELVFAGSLSEIKKAKNSVTGKYLRGEFKIEVPTTRRKSKNFLKIEGASANNLKDISVNLPLGLFTCVTGVSGSGKSTLVIDTLYRSLAHHLYKVDYGNLFVKKITGLEQIDKVIDIDQSPIGKTPRSNPATYTGLFSFIRELFASLPDAKIRGYAPGRFSFNVKGGRCDTCEGGGVTKIEMHFLPDVYVKCETCKGKRYNRETLEVKFKGKNITDILEMTAAEALPFFDSIPSIKTKLKVLNDVGLGYLGLGQSSTTLSGGEAQRIKLSRELSKRGTGKTVYILDEPSTGLHFDDIKKLISILQTLTDQGNTVVVIEHNLDIIKTADHVIDLGPEAGALGGKIVAQGTPEEVSKTSKSITGRYLSPYLN